MTAKPYIPYVLIKKGLIMNDIIYSKPLYTLTIIGGGISFIFGFIIILQFNISMIDIFIASIMIFNLFQIRGNIWGGKMSSKTMHIYFPLWEKKNKVLHHEDIINVEIVKNPIRLFKYSDFIYFRLKNRKKLVLSRMGTSSFRAFENHLKIYWM